jgi:predicted amidohydrolase
MEKSPMLKYVEIKVGLDIPDHHSNIQIALANIPVDPKQVEASYLRNPALTRKRFKTLANLLNDISLYRGQNDKKIDLLIFPEVSIPYDWQSMIVAWARKHDIGVICGLEHRVNRENEALNAVLAALPYKVASHHKACVPIRRLKRRYSPEESFVLENEKLVVPAENRESYQLIRWRGASFAVYNCYELASIEDRSIFKGKVDFIVATEFNKDVNYFSNIIESAARDLHCYVIQVNDSQFGDSRVVSPSKSEKMNPLRIKGGENLTFLTMRLDLKGLRSHQRKGYGLQKDSKDFKPTPPGFKDADVKARIQLGGAGAV